MRDEFTAIPKEVEQGQSRKYDEKGKGSRKYDVGSWMLWF